MVTKDADETSTEFNSDDEQVLLANVKPRGWKVLALVVLGVVIGGAMVIGMLSGPSVGSVFSAVTKGLGSSANSYPAAAATTEAAGATSSTTSSSSQASNQPDERMIIRTGTIAITVDNVEDTLGKMTALVNSEQGLVFSTSTNHAGDYVYANLTLQVPPAKFDETMTGIRKLANKVTSESSSSQDVTAEYVDNEAQIKNLTQTEQEFNTLLTKATNVGDVLAVQQQISTVRGQIDKLQGRQNYLSKKTSMSTITVNIAPVVAQTVQKTQAVPGWDFGKTLDNAWAGSLRGLEKLATVLITLVAFFWVVPLLLGAVWLSLKLYRRLFFQMRGNN